MLSKTNAEIKKRRIALTSAFAITTFYFILPGNGCVYSQLLYEMIVPMR